MTSRKRSRSPSKPKDEHDNDTSMMQQQDEKYHMHAHINNHTTKSTSSSSSTPDADEDSDVIITSTSASTSTSHDPFFSLSSLEHHWEWSSVCLFFETFQHHFVGNDDTKMSFQPRLFASGLLCRNNHTPPPPLFTKKRPTTDEDGDDPSSSTSNQLCQLEGCIHLQECCMFMLRHGQQKPNAINPRQWYARIRRVLQAHSPVLSHELGPFLEDATWDEITLRARIQVIKSLQEMIAELDLDMRASIQPSLKDEPIQSIPWFIHHTKFQQYWMFNLPDQGTLHLYRETLPRHIRESIAAEDIIATLPSSPHLDPQSDVIDTRWEILALTSEEWHTFVAILESSQRDSEEDELLNKIKEEVIPALERHEKQLERAKRRRMFGVDIQNIIMSTERPRRIRKPVSYVFDDEPDRHHADDGDYEESGADAEQNELQALRDMEAHEDVMRGARRVTRRLANKYEIQPVDEEEKRGQEQQQQQEEGGDGDGDGNEDGGSQDQGDEEGNEDENGEQQAHIQNEDEPEEGEAPNGRASPSAHSASTASHIQPSSSHPAPISTSAAPILQIYPSHPSPPSTSPFHSSPPLLSPIASSHDVV